MDDTMVSSLASEYILDPLIAVPNSAPPSDTPEFIDYGHFAGESDYSDCLCA